MHCWLLRVSRLIASQRRRAGAGREPSAAVLEKASTSEQPVRGESCDEVQRADNVHGNASVLQLSAGAALPRQELGRSCPVALQKPRGCRAQHPFGLEAVAAPPRGGCCPAPPRGCWRGSCRGPAGSRPAAKGCCGRSRAATARPHHSDTKPQSARICRNFNMFAPFWCSAEKWLTTRTRTCRGRAPETSTYHRTRKVAPLLCGRFLADNPKNRSRLAVHDFAY